MKKRAIKIISAAVAAATLASTAAGCAGQTNSLPEVDGAHDIDCIVNTTVDLLEGVAALDYEDGDITPDISITVTPEARVENGYAVFPEEGEYTVTYSVEDSAGGSSEETVLVNAIERETYADFKTVGGFRGTVSGGATLTRNGMYDGVYIVEADGGVVAEDIALTRTYTLDNGYNYTFTYNYNSSAAGRAYVLEPYVYLYPARRGFDFRGGNFSAFRQSRQRAVQFKGCDIHAPPRHGNGGPYGEFHVQRQGGAAFRRNFGQRVCRRGRLGSRA